MKELNCLQDCNSACCHDILFLTITADQYGNFREHGVIFEEVPVGVAFHGPCPMLVGQSCTIYLDKRLRPGQCFRVTPGDPTCLEYRAREGYHDE